jgi:hypothetical protein
MPREQFALARPADLGSLEPGLVWIVFLPFSSSLPFVAALADVTMGTITSVAAYMANVKTRAADLLMRLLLMWLEQAKFAIPNWFVMEPSRKMRTHRSG